MISAGGAEIYVYTSNIMITTTDLFLEFNTDLFFVFVRYIGLDRFPVLTSCCNDIRIKQSV